MRIWKNESINCKIHHAAIYIEIILRMELGASRIVTLHCYDWQVADVKRSTCQSPWCGVTMWDALSVILSMNQALQPQ